MPQNCRKLFFQYSFFFLFFVYLTNAHFSNLHDFLKKKNLFWSQIYNSTCLFYSIRFPSFLVYHNNIPLIIYENTNCMNEYLNMNVDIVVMIRDL
jgi:hypothetical protein